MKKVSLKAKCVYIDSNQPYRNFNFHYLPKLRLGRLDCHRKYRILSWFSIHDLPHHAEIKKATLYLFCHFPFYSKSNTIYLHLITEDWNKKKVTWNNQPKYLKETYAKQLIKETGCYTFDITDYVQSWHDDEFYNYGILIKNSELKDLTYETICHSSPLIEIEFKEKCQCECHVITTKFIEDYTEVLIDHNTHHLMTKYTGNKKTITYFVRNDGNSNVKIHLQVSPDGCDYLDNDETIMIPPNETKALTPYLFSKYTRCVVKRVNPNEISFVRIWYQAQK